MRQSEFASFCRRSKSCCSPGRLQPPICWRKRGPRDTSLRSLPNRCTRRIFSPVCAAKSSLRLHLVAPFKGARHRHFVCVFDITASGHTGGDPRDPDRELTQCAGQPACCCFPFKRRTSCENDLIYFAALHTLNEGPAAKLIRPHAVQRRKRSMQHVIDAAEAAAFHRVDVGGLLDDADEPLVARGA